MSSPFLGQLKIVSFNFAPQGWALCNGQLLSIAQNTALFSLMGTTYGGDGRNTFGLPNLQGSIPLHLSSDFSLGEVAGEASVELIETQIPPHTHTVQSSSSAATASSPAGNLLATTPIKGMGSVYGVVTDDEQFSAAVAVSGSSQPHENRQPYLT